MMVVDGGGELDEEWALVSSGSGVPAVRVW